jgi:hypothetical protein
MSLLSSAPLQWFKKPAAVLRGLLLRPDGFAVASSPTITAGNGAPTAAEPNGSIYIRCDGGVTTTVYVRVSGAWVAIPCTDTELAALAGLTSAADRLPYFTGSGTADVATFTAAARTLVAAVDAAAQRVALGLVIGTNVQAYDAELAAIAGLTSAANKVPVFSGSGTAALAHLDPDQYVIATIAVANATGTNNCALTLTLRRADNSTALASARQVMIIVQATASQYSPAFATETSVTFTTATTGSIIASGAGWALVQTDATGAFACTAVNSDDETVNYAVQDPRMGVSDVTKACIVIGSNNDPATTN